MFEQALAEEIQKLAAYYGAMEEYAAPTIRLEGEHAMIQGESGNHHRLVSQREDDAEKFKQALAGIGIAAEYHRGSEEQRENPYVVYFTVTALNTEESLTAVKGLRRDIAVQNMTDALKELHDAFGVAKGEAAKVLAEHMSLAEANRKVESIVQRLSKPNLDRAGR